MFIQECPGSGILFSRIIDLETMTEVFRLENNDKLSKTIHKFSLPKIKEFSIQLLNSPVPATVRLFLPPGYRENKEYAFPLLLDT